MPCSETRDVHPLTCNDVNVSATAKETLALDESYMEASPVLAKKASICVLESSQTTAARKDEEVKNDMVSELTDCSNAMKSNDIYLNIRLPNGTSLQGKFTIMDTLRSVKDYVNKNQITGIGSYDLAVPYPRKVFGEQGTLLLE